MRKLGHFRIANFQRLKPAPSQDYSVHTALFAQKPQVQETKTAIRFGWLIDGSRRLDSDGQLARQKQFKRDLKERSAIGAASGWRVLDPSGLAQRVIVLGGQAFFGSAAFLEHVVGIFEIEEDRGFGRGHLRRHTGDSPAIRLSP